MTKAGELLYCQHWRDVADRAQVDAWSAGYTPHGQRALVRFALHGLAHGCDVASPWPASRWLLRRLLHAYARRYALKFLKAVPPGSRVSRAQLRQRGIEL